MDFRTIYKPQKSKFDISHNSKILMLGSCFAENIGDCLLKNKFNTLINPFGIVFNPLSIEKSINRLINGELYKNEELSFFNELWLSLDHHGRFSDKSKNISLQKINNEFAEAQEFIKKANIIIITLGSAHVYKYNKTGHIVSNCHKIPSKEFTKELITIETITDGYTKLFEKLFEINKNVKIIFTISPVRYLSDGFEQNQLSKSILNVAIHNLCNNFKNVTYFPAYEIIMDDLRDYRFFANDMLHPSALSIEYIWNMFSNTYFSESTKKLILEIQEIKKAMKHKPFNSETEAYKSFLDNNKNAIINLSKTNPNIDFSEELEFFKL